MFLGWKKQSNFKQNLEEFNKRRVKVHNDGYAEFLVSSYPIAWQLHAPKFENVILTHYLGDLIDAYLFRDIRDSIHGMIISSSIRSLLGYI